MKGMKGRFLKKLKLIPTISTLKQGLVLQLSPQHPFSNQNGHGLSVYKEQDSLSSLDQKETELEFDVGEPKTITPSIEFKDIVSRKDHSQLPISSEIIIKDDSIPEVKVETEHHPSLTDSEEKCPPGGIESVDDCIPEVKVDTEEHPSLTDFEEKCPPGGEESVVFYTTSLRGIRKTFEDCSSVRFLLDSFKILVQERDISMDIEFREELWRILGGRVIPPKLFIKGRYIGGADEVVGLHEQGKLKKLLEGIPSGLNNRLCAGCANMRFLVCSNCNGSRKVYAEKEGDELCMKCPDCNENGLVKCSVCC